jgi:hypothetical protein
MHYQFGLNSEIKIIKILQKGLRKTKKIIRIRIKLKTPIHDKKKIKHVEFLNVFFLHKKIVNIN